MNILWASIYGVYLKMAEKICEEYHVKNLYLFHFEREMHEVEKTDLMPLVRERFLYLDMVEANYENYIWYDSMSPLDKELLDQMSQYEPEALKMLERQNGNDNPAEMRFIMYHKHVRYWNHFLNLANIDVFFANATPHASYDYILMRLCQLKGIPVIQGERLPIQSSWRYRLHMSYEEHDLEIVNRIKVLKQKYNSADEIKLPKDIENDYQTFTNSSSEKQIVKIHPHINHPIRDRIWLFKRYYERINPKYAVDRTLKHYQKKIETKVLVGKYKKMSIRADYSLKYIYFPMHFQPELTTSPLGDWFVHQYLAIEMLSYYAPPGVFVFVREHPNMKLYISHVRVYEHYKIISGLKNVLLISMDDDPQKLLNNCIAVASITGSCGYEALYKKKPFIMFGNQIMRYGPGTLNVRNNVDCKLAMDRIFSGKVTYSDLDIRVFLKMIDEISTTVRVSLKTGLEADTDDNLRRLLRMYKNALNKAIERKNDGAKILTKREA